MDGCASRAEETAARPVLSEVPSVLPIVTTLTEKRGLSKLIFLKDERGPPSGLTATDSSWLPEARATRLHSLMSASSTARRGLLVRHLCKQGMAVVWLLIPVTLVTFISLLGVLFRVAGVY